jgi:hypothetical protein
MAKPWKIPQPVYQGALPNVQQDQVPGIDFIYFDKVITTA